MDCDQHLDGLFKDLVINLVKHDTSPTGLPCRIVVELGKTPKDRGTTVLDLGNYIYRRLGLRYQSCPEYRGKGKKTSLHFYMSWEDVEPIRGNILKALGKEKMLKIAHYLPYEFSSLIIQNTARGVIPQQRGA